MAFNEINIDEKKLERVDTTIPKEVKAYLKEKGWKVNDLIRLGMLAKEGNPQLIERVREVEDKFKVIESRLSVIIELLNGRVK